MNSEQFNQIVKEQIKEYENQLNDLRFKLDCLNTFLSEQPQAPSSDEPEKEEGPCLYKWSEQRQGYEGSCGHVIFQGIIPEKCPKCRKKFFINTGVGEESKEVCHWKKDFDGYYTDCGYKMVGYNPNECKLCDHCGKPIKVQER